MKQTKIEPDFQKEITQKAYENIINTIDFDFDERIYCNDIYKAFYNAVCENKYNTNFENLYNQEKNPYFYIKLFTKKISFIARCRVIIIEKDTNEKVYAFRFLKMIKNSKEILN